jgi:hypothetical protein
MSSEFSLSALVFSLSLLDRAFPEHGLSAFLCTYFEKATRLNMKVGVSFHPRFSNVSFGVSLSAFLLSLSCLDRRCPITALPTRLRTFFNRALRLAMEFGDLLPSSLLDRVLATFTFRVSLLTFASRPTLPRSQPFRRSFTLPSKNKPHANHRNNGFGFGFALGSVFGFAFSACFWEFDFPGSSSHLRVSSDHVSNTALPAFPRTSLN